MRLDEAKSIIGKLTTLEHVRSGERYEVIFAHRAELPGMFRDVKGKLWFYSLLKIANAGPNTCDCWPCTERNAGRNPGDTPDSHRAPRIEQTAAGAQVVISDTPTRQIPSSALKPRRAQTDKPLALEMPEIEAKQGKLF